MNRKAGDQVGFGLGRQAALFVVLATMWSALGSKSLRAESSLPLLASFDEARLQQCSPIDDIHSVSEAAKLVYRLRRVEPKAFAALLDQQTPIVADTTTQLGFVYRVSGEVESVRRFALPEQLVDVLDLDALFEVTLVLDQADSKFNLVVPELAGSIAKGDRIEAVAIALGNESGRSTFAAGAVEWFPKATDHVGLQLLARFGVAANVIASASSRNRQVLQSADFDAFYALLGAAKEIAADESRLPVPVQVDPIKLLSEPNEYHGQWIRMTASTVRITRVDVDDPKVIQRLGQDHYFQVDSSGSLGDVIIELKREKGDSGDPIRMSGRYPLSVITPTLPGFLRERFEEENTIVMMAEYPVRIDGFFYRLWSYQNEFMDRKGGGKQIGPLIVAVRWESVEVGESAEEDVAILGYLFAAALVVSIGGTVIWSRRNSRVDLQARQAREAIATVDLSALDEPSGE